MTLKINTSVPNQAQDSSFIKNVAWGISSPVWIPFWVIKNSFNYFFPTAPIQNNIGRIGPSTPSSLASQSVKKISQVSNTIITPTTPTNVSLAASTASAEPSFSLLTATDLRTENINENKDRVKTFASKELYPKLKNYLVSFSLLTLVLNQKLDQKGLLNNALFKIVDQLYNNNNKFNLATFKEILRTDQVKIEISTFQSIMLFLSYYLIFRWVISSTVPLFCDHFIDIIFEELFDQKRDKAQLEILTTLASSFDVFMKNYADTLQIYHETKFKRSKHDFFARAINKTLKLKNGEKISQQELYDRFSKFIIRKFILSIKDSLFVGRQLHSIKLIKHDNKFVYALIYPYAIFMRLIGLFTIITASTSKSIIFALVKNIAPSSVDTTINTLNNDADNKHTINLKLIELFDLVINNILHPCTKKLKSYKAINDPVLQEKIQNFSKNMAKFIALNAKDVKSSTENLTFDDLKDDAVAAQIQSTLEEKIPELTNELLSQFLHPQEFSKLVMQLMDTASHSLAGKIHYPDQEKNEAQAKLDAKITELCNTGLRTLCEKNVGCMQRLGLGTLIYYPVSGLLTELLKDKYIKATIKLKEDPNILQSLFNHAMLSAL